MRTAIMVHIDDKSIKEHGYDDKAVLAAVLKSIGTTLKDLHLSFDCGYNPQLVTPSDIN